MKKLLYGAGAVVLIAGLALFEFRQWRISLFTDMATEKIADIETSELLFMLFGIGLVLVLVLLLVGMLRGNRISIPRSDGEVIDRNTDAGAPTTPTAAVCQRAAIAGEQPAAAHRRKAGANYINNAIRKASGETAELQVDLKRLYTLAACETPTRAEWKRERGGGNDYYTQALGFFRAHGFLTDDGHWRDEYDRQARESWLEQFEGEQ